MANNFIGTGIIFPIEISSTGGSVIKSGKELLDASIKTILYWPKHQRFFSKNFGSRIYQLIEEPNDDISKVLARNFIVDALNTWEKRTIIKDVSFLSSGTTNINIEIKYIIRSTRREETMVFPFYKEIIN